MNCEKSMWDKAIIDEKIKHWLPAYLDSHDAMMDVTEAVSYLLVWPLFEAELLEKFRKNREMISERFAPYYDELQVEKIAMHFHVRYTKNKDLYWSLHQRKHGKPEEPDDIGLIIQTPYSALNNQQKIALLIYVTTRYRNNIFHGNKRIESWHQYAEQIDLCVEFMTKILDCYKKHKREISRMGRWNQERNRRQNDHPRNRI